MRTNDLHICSFPKSGITYFSFLLAAARLHHNGIAMTPTMFNIDYLIIDLHKMTDVKTASIWRDGIGDLYKSHKPFFPAPSVIYVLRDPIDTLRSYYHFRKQLGSADSIIEFLNGPEGVSAWIRHVSSWLLDNRSASQSVFVTRYEDLTSDPRTELRALARQLGITFSDAALDFAVDAARIDRMRRLEDEFSQRNPVYSQFDLEFVRKGNARRVEEFTPELVASIEPLLRPHYDSVCRRLPGTLQSVPTAATGFATATVHA